MTWVRVMAFVVIPILLPAYAVYAQSSGDFRGGSIKVGYDPGACGANVAGAIRYDSGKGSFDFCNGTDWVDPVTFASSSGTGGNVVSGEFVGGSVIPGWDSRTCDASLEGSIRYNSASGKPEYCGLGGPAPCTTVGQECLDGTYYVDLSLDDSTSMYMGALSSESSSQAYDDATFENDPADSTTDGDGNTAALVADGPSHPAAEFCDGLDHHGHQDWYLPAKDELYLVYNSGDVIGDVDTGSGTRYWTSTEANNSSAWLQRFYTGGQQLQQLKINSNRVRCFRKDTNVMGLSFSWQEF